jgi:tetratricopeptide (TPR) repeat protein
MLLVNIILAALAGLALWWLSGFDPKVTGENRKADSIRRAARCAATVILLCFFFGPNAVRVGYAFIPLLLIVPPLLGVLWAGCLAELFARGFHRLMDHADNREYDPHQSARDLDQVASLLKSGRHEEAAQLCEALKKSGGANILVLETMLARAGIRQDGFKQPKPLAEAHRLRSEGKFDEAETVLKSLLAENPSNVDAALMLMRFYVQDLRRSDKAAEVLRSLESQPHIPSAHLEYARRSINEWGQRKSAPATTALPESVDELLAGGYLGTAIEILERKIKEQPGDLDLWLKLAEAHGRHSGNFQRAGKIVQKMEGNRAFTAEQIRLAKAKLVEWREAKPREKPV